MDPNKTKQNNKKCKNKYGKIGIQQFRNRTIQIHMGRLLRQLHRTIKNKPRKPHNKNSTPRSPNKNSKNVTPIHAICNRRNIPKVTNKRNQ